MPKRKARGTLGPLRRSARHPTGPPPSTDHAVVPAEQPSPAITQVKQEGQDAAPKTPALLYHPCSHLGSPSLSIPGLPHPTLHRPPHDHSSSAINAPNSDIDVKPIVSDIATDAPIAMATQVVVNGASSASTVEKSLKPPAKPAEGPAPAIWSKVGTVKVEEDLSVKQEIVEPSPAVITKQDIQAGPSSTLPALGSLAKTGFEPTKKVRSKKVAGEAEERRPARFRKRCPQNIQDRVDRVMTQRMFMIDRQKFPGVGLSETFKVLGSTGNVYTVTIDQQPRCDCPDCRKGNVPCKHIIFVFMKVLKVPTTSITWYQKGLLTSELQEIFNAAPNAQTGPSAVSAKVRNAYLRAIGVLSEEQAEEVEEQAKGEGGLGNKRVSAIGEDCPVCFEEMSEEDQTHGRLVFDESLAGCGKRMYLQSLCSTGLRLSSVRHGDVLSLRGVNRSSIAIHKVCFNMWAAAAVQTSGNVTCVWCRSPWPIAEGGSSSKGKGKAGVEYTSAGYMNMADIAGMDRQRDTSTYYWGPMAGRRMWEARYEDD
ncbi:hypothetical protein DB88DRAFT_541064 [Papiliotrema laurentii]|uniref:SWIM-type domain-containing protein n=1 Tax=Papiliotrema laurentii TaxID=5418 RepID=A0AAD9CVJ6_PAPLA|nr:hypothetical protein DB88DRAFT_541064 [Papiliotrema laurentii]